MEPLTKEEEFKFDLVKEPFRLLENEEEEEEEEFEEHPEEKQPTPRRHKKMKTSELNKNSQFKFDFIKELLEEEEEKEEEEIQNRVGTVKAEIRRGGPGSVDCMTLGPEFWKAIRELKGSTISEHQKHLEEAVRKQKHFVSHQGRFEMLSVNEVEMPEESNGEVYERYCTSCEMTITLAHWLNHVKTQYHQIKFKTKVALLGFCWYKQPNINVHDPSDCSECMRRMQLNRNYCDKLENIKEYRQGEDEEFLEMQKDIKEVEKVLNKYNCELCNVKCHTEEYFSNHLKGRKHKELKDCKKRKTEPTDNATPHSSQKKNYNTGKRKRSEIDILNLPFSDLKRSMVRCLRRE